MEIYGTFPIVWMADRILFGFTRMFLSQSKEIRLRNIKNKTKKKTKIDFEEEEEMMKMEWRKI